MFVSSLRMCRAHQYTTESSLLLRVLSLTVQTPNNDQLHHLPRTAALIRLAWTVSSREQDNTEGFSLDNMVLLSTPLAGRSLHQ